jgi:hypothetical protein
LKFQFQALARFGAITERKCRGLRDSHNTLNGEHFKLIDELRSKSLCCAQLEEEVSRLKVSEAKYHGYKQRAPEITEYLNAFAAMKR